MIATLRLFSGRAPVLIKTIFGVGATVDGFSLDNVVIQCAIKIGFWNQVSVFLLMPFFAVAVPPLITYILYQLHRKCLPGKV